MVLKEMKLLSGLKRNEESFYFTPYVSCGEQNHKFPSIKHTKTTFVTSEFRECSAPTVGLPGVGRGTYTSICIQDPKKGPNSLHFPSPGPQGALYVCSLASLLNRSSTWVLF